MSVTWKPVPKMIVSTSRSLPSLGHDRVRPHLGQTASVTTSTFGFASAGYHSLVGRMRLQPML